MGDSPCRLHPQPCLAACTGQRSGYWDVPSWSLGSRSQLLRIHLQVFLTAERRCRCVSVHLLLTSLSSWL